MKYLRWALGVLVGLYVLRNLYYFVLTVGGKTGMMPLTGANTGFEPLVAAFAWWQLVAWAVAIGAYAMATVRYFRGGKALIPLVVGFLIDAAMLVMLRGMAAYQQVVPADVQQMDIICIAGVFVAVVLTWWTERSSSSNAAAV